MREDYSDNFVSIDEEFEESVDWRFAIQLNNIKIENLRKRDVIPFPFPSIYWKCNPSCLSVGGSVSSVIISLKGKLHFPAPIGALVVCRIAYGFGP